MAETLRALGDLSTTELFGPVERLLEELREDGRAVRIDLPGTAEPMRWILAEDETRYRRAFPSGGEHDLGALGSIVRQYLRTHALIGMAELCRRYPIAPELAAEMLDHWVETGGLIRLAAADPEAECRWAEPENLAEIHRLSVAIRRRESVAVAPEVFADFLLRRQHLHPATRLDGPGGLEVALQQLQGYAAAAEFWESEILPRRVRGYRTAWLDDLLATGCWLWRAARDGRDEPSVALVPRDFAGEWRCRLDEGEKSADERQVLDVLAGRGASFATDLARVSGLEPSRLRRALRDLMLRGQVTNDRFDPLRPGAFDMIDALVEARAAGSGRLHRVRPRRVNAGRADGRWALLEPSNEGEEDRPLAWLGVLLERYGILTRELVELDLWAPAWADLAPLLARAELRGELRRGYFVEGFSGVQYASDEAAEGLSRLAGSLPPGAEDILLAAADPANLYGSGAPLDIPLLDGGTARLSRFRQLPRHEGRSSGPGHRSVWQAPDRPGLRLAARGARRPGPRGRARRTPAASPQGRNLQRRARPAKPGCIPPCRARVCTRSSGYDVLRSLGQARPSDRGDRSTPWRLTSGLLIKGSSEDGWQCLVKSQPCG